MAITSSRSITIGAGDPRTIQSFSPEHYRELKKGINRAYLVHSKSRDDCANEILRVVGVIRARIRNELTPQNS